MEEKLPIAGEKELKEVAEEAKKFTCYLTSEQKEAFISFVKSMLKYVAKVSKYGIEAYNENAQEYNIKIKKLRKTFEERYNEI